MRPPTPRRPAGKPPAILPLVLVAAAAGFAPRVLAEGTAPATGTATAPANPPAAPAAPAASHPGDAKAKPSKSGLKGITKGSSRLFLYGGLAAGKRGSTNVSTTPSGVSDQYLTLRIRSGATEGLSYSYQWHDTWGIELGYELARTHVGIHPAYDAPTVDTILANAIQSDVRANRTTIEARLAARAGPVTLDVRYLDLGLSRVFNGRSRWIGEAGGGIGLSQASLPGGRRVFEQVFVRNIQPPVYPATTPTYDIGTPSDDPTNGQGCPPGSQCVVERNASSLTYHAYGGVSYAFNDHVHLRMVARVRDVNRVVDPGSSFLSFEGLVGLSFLFGGR